MAPEGRPSGPVVGITLRSLAGGFLFGEMSRPLRTPLRGYVATGAGVTVNELDAEKQNCVEWSLHVSQNMKCKQVLLHLPVEGLPVGLIPATR